MRPWAAVAIVAVLSMSACGGEDPPNIRGVPPTDHPQPAAGSAAPASSPPGTSAEAANAARKAAAARLARSRKRPAQDEPTPEPAPGAAVTPGAGPKAIAPEVPKRDLGTDMALLANADQCLDLRAIAGQPGGKLDVTISGYVMPSGRISSATVRAAGQDSKALDCMKRNVEAGRLGGDLPAQPTSVSGTIPMAVEPNTSKP